MKIKSEFAMWLYGVLAFVSLLCLNIMDIDKRKHNGAMVFTIPQHYC